jgi:hypothetical protein
LKLSFVDTLVGSAGATQVHFSVAGIDPSDDAAVITFKDQNGKTATATVASNGTATADLSGLADGPITASMLVTDTANNTFTATSSNSATLDQDKLEKAVTVNGGNPISAAIANAVPFTVAGIEGDDNGSVSFSDGTHAPVVVNITNGALSAATANLSGLNDGTITATLHLKNDAAGNSFTDVVTKATLDQDKVAETPFPGLLGSLGMYGANPLMTTLGIVVPSIFNVPPLVDPKSIVPVRVALEFSAGAFGYCERLARSVSKCGCGSVVRNREAIRRVDGHLIAARKCQGSRKGP